MARILGELVMIKMFKDQQAASEAMAEDFKAIAVKAVSGHGRFTVALTGGRSPVGLYQILASDPYIKSVPWSKSYIFWGDERAVPFDHEQNNARMAFETLLNHIPVPTNHIFRINSELSPQKAAEAYEKQLKKHFKGREPSFDLVLLGMGEDAHTASIFPGSDLVHEQEKWVATSYNEGHETDRISLTAPLINRAENIFFAVFGRSKAATLREVLEGEYQPEILPAQLIKPDHGQLSWYVDEEAANFLMSNRKCFPII